MRNGGLILVVLMVVVAGCSTTSGPLFNHSETMQFSGREALGKIDPAAKVDPSQAGVLGINGPSGPYAAVITAATIDNPKARTEAFETIKAISDNEASYGFRGRRGRVGRGGFYTNAYDEPQRGALVNNADSTRLVQFLDEETIVPVTEPIEIPAKSYLFVDLLPNVDPGYRMLVTDINEEKLYEAHVRIDEELRDASFFIPKTAQSVRTNWAIPIIR